MRQGLFWVLLTIFYGIQPTFAGVQIVPAFKVGAKPLPEVLSHVQLKSVVAEFVDPMDTGIGKSLGYLIWRETLTAISDQAGAGVILARTPSDERIVDMLERDYHRAARQIAEHQRARMILWGAVVEDGKQLYINTNLTLLTGSGESDLHLKYLPRYQRLHMAKFMAGRAARPRPSAPIEAKIPRSRFNFSMVETSREELFERVVITRRKTNLRAGPSRDAALITQVKAGAVLQSIDMEGAWFKLRLADGRVAYVSNDQVDLPPSRIEVDAKKINLRDGPGTDFKVTSNSDLFGTFEVTDMRYRQGKGLWYGIKFNGKKVWIWGGLARARFSLPAVHFLAGMYRFYGERFGNADAEFAQFISAPGVKASNVNLATAYQLQGASQLSKRNVREIPEAFTKAIKLTPYDPSAYLLRAVAELQKPRTRLKAVADLDQALALDRQDKNTRAVVTGLSAAIEEEQRLSPASNEKLHLIRGDLLRLKRHYKIRELTPSRPLLRRIEPDTLMLRRTDIQ